MSIIVTDQGFAPDDYTGEVLALADLPQEGSDLAVELAPSDDPGLLSNRLATLAFIKVRFPSFADGRGFTIAARLRRMGFKGRLRAVGHVIADQYAMARRSGFDEVEISDELAQRQPEPQWLRRADWQAHDYHARVMRRA